MEWALLGFEINRRWHKGKTWLDTAGGDHLLVHHGWFSLEWARGPHVAHFKAIRIWCRAR